MILSTPSIPLNTFSTLSVTFVSIISALAPGYVVITIPIGKSISGNNATGNLNRAKSPKNINNNAKTSVKIGLDIAILYII